MKSNSTLETSSDMVMNQVSLDSVSQENCKIMSKECFKSQTDSLDKNIKNAQFTKINK